MFDLLTTNHIHQVRPETEKGTALEFLIRVVHRNMQLILLPHCPKMKMNEKNEQVLNLLSSI